MQQLAERGLHICLSCCSCDDSLISMARSISIVPLHPCIRASGGRNLGVKQVEDDKPLLQLSLLVASAPCDRLHFHPSIHPSLALTEQPRKPAMHTATSN